MPTYLFTIPVRYDDEPHPLGAKPGDLLALEAENELEARLWMNENYGPTAWCGCSKSTEVSAHVNIIALGEATKPAVDLDKALASPIDATTLRTYFRDLLETLWQEGENFNGKNPFGGSGWQHDVAVALWGNDCLDATETAYDIDYDDEELDKLVLAMIDRVFAS